MLATTHCAAQLCHQVSQHTSCRSLHAHTKTITQVLSDTWCHMQYVQQLPPVPAMKLCPPRDKIACRFHRTKRGRHAGRLVGAAG